MSPQVASKIMAVDGVPEAQQLDFELEPPSPDGAAELKRRIDAALAAAQRFEARKQARRPERAARPLSPLSPDSPESASNEPSDGEAATREAALSVSAFFAQVKSALQGAFPDEIWIIGEIRDFRERKGHRYIELADEATTAERGAGAQLEVACWARDWPRVKKQLDEAGVSLEAGRVVRVRGKVSVWEGGSKIRFTLTEIDIESLLGGIAATRRRLLAALEQEGLLDANRRLALSPVPLRIGLVTSPDSEGHHDFVGQLERSGFAFSLRLEPTLVQGSGAPAQIAAAISRLHTFDIDLAVVVRGGGSRSDLAAFDSEPVARAIAMAPFPVWTGVGHTGDRSVADEVAHLALITPTHCGEAVVARVCDYLDNIDARVGELVKIATAQIELASNSMHTTASTLRRIARNELDWKANDLITAKSKLGRCVTVLIEREQMELSSASSRVSTSARRLIAADEKDITRRRQVLRAYDPALQLERGWSLTSDEHGRLVRSIDDVAVGTRITTRLSDGKAESIIERMSPTDSSEEA